MAPPTVTSARRPRSRYCTDRVQRSAPASTTAKLVVVHPERRRSARCSGSQRRRCARSTWSRSSTPRRSTETRSWWSTAARAGGAGRVPAAGARMDRGARRGARPPIRPVVDALLAAGWDHVIAHPMPMLAEELLATAQKLIRARLLRPRQVHGVGRRGARLQLDDAIERDAAVGCDRRRRRSGRAARPHRLAGQRDRRRAARERAVRRAGRRRPATRFRTGEPRDKRANAGRARRRDLRWATDARYLAIEVRDRWGTLELPAIHPGPAGGDQDLDRRGWHGAAAGVCVLNQFVVDLAPRAMTEVICCSTSATSRRSWPVRRRSTRSWATRRGDEHLPVVTAGC